MDYAKDEILKVRYNTKLKLLKTIKQNWTSKLSKIMNEHKIITITIIAFIMFSALNVIMIYNFIKIIGIYPKIW